MLNIEPTRGLEPRQSSKSGLFKYAKSIKGVKTPIFV